MAEITWKNVSDVGQNDAFETINKRVDKFNQSINSFVDVGTGAIDMYQKKMAMADDEAARLNTAYLQNQMANIQTPAELDSFRQSGLNDASYLTRIFQNKLDLDKINQNIADLPKSVLDRAISNDSMQDYTPESQDLMRQLARARSSGDYATYSSLLSNANLSTKTLQDLANNGFSMYRDHRDFEMQRERYAIQDAQWERQQNWTEFSGNRSFGFEMQKYQTDLQWQLGSQVNDLVNKGNVLNGEMQTLASELEAMRNNPALNHEALRNAGIDPNDAEAMHNYMMQYPEYAQKYGELQVKANQYNALGSSYNMMKSFASNLDFTSTQNITSTQNNSFGTPSLKQGATTSYKSISKLSDGTPLNVAVYNAYVKAGLSHNQALAITAEVGRENGFQADILFGSHTDPAPDKKGKSIKNTGMLSWNGKRGTNLTNYLTQQGVMQNGVMQHTQAAIDAQAQFSVNEMRGAYAGRLSNFLNNPNADPESFAKELGKKYIVWAYGQNTIRAKGGGRKAFNWKKHDSKRRGYLTDLAGMFNGGGSSSSAPSQSSSSKSSGSSSPSNLMYFGDSIAHGYKFPRNPYGAKDFSTTKGGDSPKAVYSRITKYIKDNPNGLKGKTVVLSSGKSNMVSGQDDYIRKQIKALQDAGATVHLLGIADNYRNPKYAPNANPYAMTSDLKNIAKEMNVPFLGNFHGADGVHPGGKEYKNPSFLAQLGDISTVNTGGSLGGGGSVSTGGGNPFTSMFAENPFSTISVNDLLGFGGKSNTSAAPSSNQPSVYASSIPPMLSNPNAGTTTSTPASKGKVGIPPLLKAPHKNSLGSNLVISPEQAMERAINRDNEPFRKSGTVRGTDFTNALSQARNTAREKARKVSGLDLLQEEVAAKIYNANPDEMKANEDIIRFALTGSIAPSSDKELSFTDKVNENALHSTLNISHGDRTVFNRLFTPQTNGKAAPFDAQYQAVAERKWADKLRDSGVLQETDSFNALDFSKTFKNYQAITLDTGVSLSEIKDIPIKNGKFSKNKAFRKTFGTLISDGGFVDLMTPLAAASKATGGDNAFLYGVLHEISGGEPIKGWTKAGEARAVLDAIAKLDKDDYVAIKNSWQAHQSNIEMQKDFVKANAIKMLSNASQQNGGAYADNPMDTVRLSGLLPEQVVDALVTDALGIGFTGGQSSENRIIHEAALPSLETVRHAVETAKEREFNARLSGVNASSFSRITLSRRDINNLIALAESSGNSLAQQEARKLLEDIEKFSNYKIVK